MPRERGRWWSRPDERRRSDWDENRDISQEPDFQQGYGRDPSYRGEKQYGRGRDWGYPRRERRFESHDDESYFRSGAPERAGRGYIGGERSQGYVGFGPNQGFWRSEEDRPRRWRGRGHGEGWGEGSWREGRDRSWWDRTKDEVASWVGDEDAERRRRMDDMEDYRGRGPRGYTRSDGRISEDVNDRLTDDPYLDATNIEVQVANCEVTLNGVVNSRGDKRRAEDIAENVSGVAHVQNNLRVKAPTIAGEPEP